MEMNCTPEAQQARADAGNAEPDPDIAGLGVIIAFLSTGFITVIAIVFAYFTQALEDRLLSPVDRRVINRMKPINDKSRNKKAEYRIKAVRSLLVSLSDQQAVLALAMLIAVFARWSTITSWSALTVSNLVFVSAYVHIGTISALQMHFREHKILKWLRGFFMTATLALWILVSVLVLLWSANDSDSQIFFACNVRSYSRKDFYGAALPMISRAIIILRLLFDYIGALRTLFSDREATGGFSDRWVKRRLEGYGSTVEFEETEAIRDQIKRNSRHPLSSLQMRLRAFHYMENYAFNAVSRSFIGSEITDLLGCAVYGSIVLIRDRLEYINGLNQEERTKLKDMGFGQVVPLVLLLLPLFAALQGGFDYKDDMLKLSNVHVGSESLPNSPIASFGTSFNDGLTTSDEDLSIQQIPGDVAEHTSPIEPDSHPDDQGSTLETQSIDIATQHLYADDDEDLDEQVTRQDTTKMAIADNNTRNRGTASYRPGSWDFWISDEELSEQRDISALTILWTFLQIVSSMLFGILSALPNLGSGVYFAILSIGVGIWFRHVANNVELVIHARNRTKVKRAWSSLRRADSCLGCGLLNSKSHSTRFTIRW